MTTFNGYPLTYDADGQTLTDTSNTYTWDTRRHLTNSYQTSLGSGYGQGFVYDALGRRVQVTDEAAGTTAQYLYDGLNPVALTAGSAVTNLLTGLSIDEYFSFTNSTGAASLLTDALGSTLALTDSTGAVFSTSVYEPFGRQPVGIGHSPSSPLITIPFEFTGREDDDGTVYYYRARYYNTYLQRFLSQDPIGLWGGTANLYEYAFNAPTMFIDPFGLQSWIKGIQYDANGLPIGEVGLQPEPPLPDVTVGIDSPVGGVQTILPFSSGGSPTTVQRGPSINVPFGPDYNLKLFPQAGPAQGQMGGQCQIRGPFGGVSGGVSTKGLIGNVIGPQVNFPLPYGANLYIGTKWSANAP